MSINLNQNLTELKGIGPKSSQALEKLGLINVGDLINFFPRDYKDYKEPVAYKDLQENYFMTVCGELVTRPFLKRGSKMDVVTAKLQIDGGLVDLTWFRQAYLVQTLKVGEKYFIHGRIKIHNRHFVIEQGEIYNKDQYRLKMQGLQPVYSLTKGISNNFIEKYIKEILDNPDFQDDLILNQNNFKEIAADNGIDIPKSGLYSVMHFPYDKEEFFKARNYLVFKEFLIFLLSIRAGRAAKEKSPNPMTTVDSSVIDEVIKKLPYKLTDDQNKALNEMISDMKSPYAMECMLQGDVGSGKTIVAFLLMFMAGLSGYQSVMMAPTEVLAMQHFEKIEKMIREMGLPFKACLLTSSVKGMPRKIITSGILGGAYDIIIGTNAIIQDSIEYKNVALVITDEQHKFGVKQREKLYNKGASPHFLVMSATPIPRTLSLILYGDLKMITIKSMPANRKAIKNVMIQANEREKAYRFIYKELVAGHQAYVICPLVDEGESRSGENVKDYKTKLELIFDQHGYKVGVLHGKMKPEEKNQVMDDFKNKKIHILVSTTVVEVGVDVPNATVMMIENADTFGLASLHQLRGRVGRSNLQSYCIFVNGSGEDKKSKRLEVMVSTNDGFVIADEDLKTRGPGELFGTRQSGQFKFDIGDVYQDSSVLQKASSAADKILGLDSELQSEQYAFLRAYLRDLSTV